MLTMKYMLFTQYNRLGKQGESWTYHVQVFIARWIACIKCTVYSMVFVFFVLRFAVNIIVLFTFFYDLLRLNMKKGSLLII